MNLKTGRVITRRKVTEIPVTDLVCKAVENLAKEDGITELKFKYKTKTKKGDWILDADWIAGVDYEDNKNQNDDDEEDEDYDYEPEDDEEYEEEIDPEELAELEDKGRNNNPIESEERQDQQEPQEEQEVAPHVSDESVDLSEPEVEPRRSGRAAAPID